MLKEGTFVKKKYNNLLFFSILSYGAYGLNMMISSIVGGFQLGEVALSAISIVSPIFMIAYFTPFFAKGCKVLFSRHIGEFDSEGANKTATMGIFAVLGSSAIMILFLLLIKQPFLNYFGCTGELYEQASTYYNWCLGYVALYPISDMLYHLILADGDGLLSAVGYVSDFSTNLILSIILCRFLGVTGIGIALCAGPVMSNTIYCLHFLRKSNSYRFRPYWSWTELKKAGFISLPYALNYLFISVVDIIINKIIIVACGGDMIPAYSAINMFFNLAFVFCAINDAGGSFISSFLGERNNAGIQFVIKTCTRSIIMIGLTLSVLFFFMAPLIPKILGITTPEVVSATITAVRIMSISSIPLGFIFVAHYIYPAIDKVGLSILSSFLFNFFCPLALSIPFAFIWGFTGLSIGMSAGSFLAVALFALIACARNGKKGFPLYLEEFGEESVSYDIEVNTESMASLRDTVIEEIKSRGFNVEHVDLLIEELYTRIMEKNLGKKIISQCTVLFGKDYYRIIVRDTGVIFRLSDENNPVESINSHVLNSLLERTKEKEYSLTISFNRNGFIFRNC